MVARMQTSRAQLDRFLAPDKTAVSIDTIQQAASLMVKIFFHEDCLLP